MTFKEIIKLFLPPIFVPNIFLETFRSIFRENDRIFFEPNSVYSRHAFILKALSKFQNKNVKYLEIGVDRNQVFNCIYLKANQKIGVDPKRGGGYRMTSDQFFKKNKSFFDVIFIDGFHEYYQCQRDVINSIKCLNLGGIIILHDCIPKNSYEEAMPQKQNASTGNVWKVCVELSQSKNIDFAIANTDSGIGIIRIRKEFHYKFIPNLDKLNFEDFVDKYYKKLPIVSSEEALNFIDKK
jgi:hypothetical protein